MPPMNKNDGIARWPDGTPKSTENHFSLCYDGRPHGFIPGPALPTAVKLPARKKGGFSKHNGTLHGLGSRPHAMTIKKIRA